LTVSARIRIYVKSAQYDYPGETTTFLRNNRKVIFSPDLINVGTVAISISNGDNEGHEFEIDGVTSPAIGPGGRAVIKVTFKKPGVYPAAVISDDPIFTVTGALRVIK